jgi:malate dehydrogenase
VNAFVLGGHGDTMVPVLEYSTINGMPVPDLVKMGKSRRSASTPSSSAPARAAARSSACSRPVRPIYAPATSAIAMAEAYLYDQKRILPCAVLCRRPVRRRRSLRRRAGGDRRGGAEEVIEINLDDEAKANFQVSVDAVKELLVACIIRASAKPGAQSPPHAAMPRITSAWLAGGWMQRSPANRSRMSPTR